MSQPVQHTWHWQFDKPVSVIWDIFADTARFNEAAGFPAHTIREEQQPDGAMRYFGSAAVNSYQLDWEEIPVNWIRYEWFTHERRFSRGPFSLVTAEVALASVPTGCICHYTLRVQPANYLGRILLLTGFFRNTAKKFLAMAATARAYADQQAELPFDFSPPDLVPGALQRCQQLMPTLLQSPFHHGLLERLIKWILERPEVDVWTLRPKLLARYWQASEKDVIEMFLLAAKHGLLSLRWDLLCPNCRVGKVQSSSMDEIPQGAHCSSCNIDYGRNFSRNVELVFHPSKSLRPLHGGDYCLFGPMSTPHIVVQLKIDAGSSRSEQFPMPVGSYRIRTLEPGNDLFLDHTGGPPPTLAFLPDNQLGFAQQAQPVADTLTIHNQSQRDRILIIEYRAWMQEVLTAKEAITFQCFRDLFDENILRPGDHVEIDSVTLLFTDIKASTSLYERIGDAAAFALVREHFAILAGCVRHHNGTVVKTLGDAIMAAFNVPLDAVNCAIEIQAAFAGFNRSLTDHDEKVLVKLGLHTGPCIAVTLNGILDYYGKVANQTARIQTLCQGGDIVLSQDLAAEPSVATVLQRLPTEAGRSELKGISGEFDWVRLSAETLAAIATQQTQS